MDTLSTEADLHSDHRRMFFNRELSWLRFNTRVLDMAQSPSLPLLERLKFLAIYATNLDEFYMIRIAGLKRLYAQGVAETEPEQLSVKEQLERIEAYIREEKERVQDLHVELCALLAHEGLVITDFNSLSSANQQKMRDYFKRFIYPVIVPHVVDCHAFHLPNLSLAVALRLRSQNQERCAIIKIPQVLKRFILVEDGVFVNIESVITAFARDLFCGFEILDSLTFRVTRNADIEIEEHEADDLLQVMSHRLKVRENAQIVRLEFDSKDKIPLKSLIKNILQEPCLESEIIDFYSYSVILNMGSLWEIVEQKRFAHLCFPPFHPKIVHENQDLFEVMKKQDILLFQPYESFESVVDFLTQAANDPAVLAIKITLYRVGKDSPIVRALIAAAEKKQVTALVELKARFDEENNLHWAKALEEAGAHVIYGIPRLKVHAKVALVIRQENESLKGYVHLGTGNYNPQSARIYTDISYFTTKKEIVEDVISLFHSLFMGVLDKRALGHLFLSPLQIKPKILELIAAECAHKDQGHIILKANALLDSDVICALYAASRQGVRIDLLIRGICTLIPQVPGMSENIRVFSLVGKYLEHARIYYFKHHEQLFFSSADLMPRNLTRRIELLCACDSRKLHEILRYQLLDSTLYELQSSGDYERVDREYFSAQSFFESYFTQS